MSIRKTFFLFAVWLIPVIILASFIVVLRTVIMQDKPITTVKADSPPAADNNPLKDMPKNTAANSVAEKPVEKTSAPPKTSRFYDALKAAMSERQRKIEELCERGDTVAERVLNDYGAVFLAHNSVKTPPVCMFPDADAVRQFQNSTDIAAENISGATIELQKAAMTALLNARREAQANGLDITPRDGAEAARRSFEDTLRLWDSRFTPALKHWSGNGKITVSEAARLKSLPLKLQIVEVLKLEAEGIFFSKDFSKSILYSVAAPGCSQHLSLLAFDANEFQNPQIRRILAKHGWHRTVQNDLPHFTFLGHQENELTALGLKKLETKDGDFWIPNV